MPAIFYYKIVKTICIFQFKKLFCSKLSLDSVHRWFVGKSDKFLGEFEQMVLLALLQLKENAYGAAIRQLLDQQIKRTVALGALYATLERLEKKGLVSSKLGEATPERGGRPKRFFKVTNDGLKALQRAKDAMDTLWQHVPNQPFEV